MYGDSQHKLHVVDTESQHKLRLLQEFFWRMRAASMLNATVYLEISFCIKPL